MVFIIFKQQNFRLYSVQKAREFLERFKGEMQKVLTENSEEIALAATGTRKT